MLPRMLVFCLASLYFPGYPTAATDVPSTPSPSGAVTTPVAALPSVNALAGAVRGFVVRNAPGVLYEKTHNWGHTAAEPTGIKWTGQGLQTHPKITKSQRNDGKWRRVRVTAPNLADSLTLELKNLQQPEPGRTLVDVYLTFDARVELERENWKAGIRLDAWSARARARVKVALACELTARVDWSSGLGPDGVFRLRVVHADFNYDRFVLEHVAGIGGDAAKAAGDVIRSIIHRWQPALEQELLAKANAAIEKAADTKEIRIGLGSLMRAKSKRNPTAANTAKDKPG